MSVTRPHPVAVYVVRSVRLVVCSALWLLLFLFLVLFLHYYPHPPRWDNWLGLNLLEKAAEPLLAPIHAALNLPDAAPFYTLAMALVCSILLITLDSNLRAIRRKLEGKTSLRS